MHKMLILSPILLVAVINSARADDAKPVYPDRAPVAEYLMASRADEIVLARSGAPPSIADQAGILVLDAHGYETVVKSTNGFTCYVARSWDADIDDPEFWNPKVRGPMCLNATAMRWYFPIYRQRTEWVLSGSGVSKGELIAKTKAAIAANQITVPPAGAMCFMLSHQGYLSDQGLGPRGWHPIVVFWNPHVVGAEWGADVPGSPIVSAPSDLMPFTVFFVPLRKWSDGTLAEYDQPAQAGHSH
jgi:hypothetical protein